MLELGLGIVGVVRVGIVRVGIVIVKVAVIFGFGIVVGVMNVGVLFLFPFVFNCLSLKKKLNRVVVK